MLVSSQQSGKAKNKDQKTKTQKYCLVGTLWESKFAICDINKTAMYIFPELNFNTDTNIVAWIRPRSD